MKNALEGIDKKGIHLFAEFIKYNIPKSYYPRLVKEIDEKIQEIYYKYIDRTDSFSDECIEVPAEIIRRTSPISDEEEVENLRIVEKVIQKAQKYSITSLRSFINGFQDLTNST